MHAQDEKFDLFGGYSYMRLRGSPFVNLLGSVADFDGHYGSGASAHTFRFGPEIFLPASVSPFGHLLL